MEDEENEVGFIHIAALTANVLLWLSKKKVDGGHEDERQPDKPDDEHAGRKLPVVR